MGDKKMVLPPGLQFDPTDEELIVYFLCRKAASLLFYPNIIPDLDIYAADPWELNEKAFSSKGGWYFFSRLTGQNRSTSKGFWKEVGLSEPIFTNNGEQVGMKNYLVFFGADEVGSMLPTNWIMQEYHLLKGGFTNKSSQVRGNHIQDMNEWVLCRVHDQTHVVDSQERDYNYNQSNSDDGVELSYLDEIFFSMEDDQDEITYPS